MRSLDDPPRSAADLRRLTHVSALFDYAELLTQYPAGIDRDHLIQQLAREAAQLSAVNMISRQERDRVIEILSDAAAQESPSAPDSAANPPLYASDAHAPLA